jgi:hypothetical protein
VTVLTLPAGHVVVAGFPATTRTLRNPSGAAVDTGMIDANIPLTAWFATRVSACGRRARRNLQVEIME